jgi:hypothetical protein
LEDPPDDFDEVVTMWLPLTLALNQVNRSMGGPDLYPFVLAPAVIEKLRFVHRLVRQCDRGSVGLLGSIPGSVVGTGGR